MPKKKKKRKKVENRLGRTRFRSPLLLAWQPRCWICGAARSRPAEPSCGRSGYVFGNARSRGTRLLLSPRAPRRRWSLPALPRLRAALWGRAETGSESQKFRRWGWFLRDPDPISPSDISDCCVGGSASFWVPQQKMVYSKNHVAPPKRRLGCPFPFRLGDSMSVNGPNTYTAFLRPLKQHLIAWERFFFQPKR